MAFTYSRTVTVNHLQVQNVDQTNFPVLVAGTYPWLKTIANGGHVSSATGLDIAFSSDMNGLSILNFERVGYDPSTGQIEFWVQVPLVSASVDKVFYIVYGSPGATDRSNKNAVWDSHYKGVFHFGDGAVLDLSDSTSNGVVIANHGATAAMGIFGGAAGFASASTQYIDCGAPFNFPGGFSIEIWSHYTGSPFPSNRAFSNKSPTGDGYEIYTRGNGQENAMLAATGSGSTVAILGSSNLGASTSAYDAYAYTGSAIADYGGDSFAPYLHPAAPVAATVGNSSSDLLLAKQAGSGSSYYDGWIEEFRISDSPRSADYFATSFNSQAVGYQHSGDARFFLSLGPEVSIRAFQQPQVYVIT